MVNYYTLSCINSQPFFPLSLGISCPDSTIIISLSAGIYTFLVNKFRKIVIIGKNKRFSIFCKIRPCALPNRRSYAETALSSHSALSCTLLLSYPPCGAYGGRPCPGARLRCCRGPGGPAHPAAAGNRRAPAPAPGVPGLAPEGNHPGRIPAEDWSPLKTDVPWLPKALVSVEDKRFSHHGIDPDGISGPS